MSTHHFNYCLVQDDSSIRNRVKVAVGLLIGAKVLNVSVPFLFKYAVDDLNTKVAAPGSDAILNFSTAPDTIASTAVALLIGCRFLTLIILFQSMNFNTLKLSQIISKYFLVVKLRKFFV